MLLGEVVLAVALEELVVGPHQTAHHVDEVPEDLHSAHLGAGLQQEPKVLLLRVFAFNQVTERRPHRHRPVAVAELPVVVHLEAGAHRMVLDAKGVEDGEDVHSFSVEIRLPNPLEWLPDVQFRPSYQWSHFRYAVPAQR